MAFSSLIPKAKDVVLSYFIDNTKISCTPQVAHGYPKTGQVEGSGALGTVPS